MTKTPDSLSPPAGDPVEVKVYVITGRQLFFTVGRSTCEECDLTVEAVRMAFRGLEGIPVSFKIEAWLNKLPFALSKGAYHPPITLVDGKVISQGIVPDVEDVRLAIVKAAERRRVSASTPQSPSRRATRAPGAIFTISSLVGLHR
jgi:hypothetical protein